MDITQNSKTKRDISPIFLFALTLFSSATLMFVLQPMFGKALLPLLGGSASVWNTCMVFYQSILFLGYLYAHLLSTHLSYRKQLVVHCILILISLSFLPVSIPENSIPPAQGNPSIWLLSTLLLSIGLPFFILSTTSPLLQKWFSNLGHQTSNDPYYLSIASNSGSLLALLSYPFLLEPAIGLSEQQQFWSSSFLVLCALISICMMQIKHHQFQSGIEKQATDILISKPTLKLQLQWLLLAFVPSSLLLGTTNYISIDIATVPLLWVIPLALYLLSFIIVFSRYSASFHKKIFFIQPWCIAPFLIYYFSDQKLASFTQELVFHLLAFFISIMVCHGELAKKRPTTQYLTQFYLIMSFGGMLGGVFNSFLAPVFFSSIYEYPLMIVFALFLNPLHQRIKLKLKNHFAKIIFSAYMLTFLAVLSFNYDQFDNVFLVTCALIAGGGGYYYLFNRNPFYFPLIGLLLASCAAPDKQQGDQLLHQSRNFYGVLSVKKNTQVKVGEQLETLHEIYSGTTKHGSQLISDKNFQCKSHGYYSQKGPLGSIFDSFDTQNDNWQIGVIGLGAGEMVGYSKQTQQWTFFELNPSVVDIATNSKLFTFLNECIKDYDLQIGDARITLENQLKKYDLLVIDAFTSDSIPTHLLTKEAIELYFFRLNSNGLLVFHISNRYLALKKVLSDHSEKLGLTSLIQEYRPKQKIPLVYKSDWAVLARNEADLAPLLVTNTMDNKWEKLPQYQYSRTWTDDYTSIINVWK